tara:strand:+ start:90 stop:1025 length:936 start_codon:yes stop_codon:yes gene_type:complete
MAVSVDTVYRTVLLIMNKESRGYLTPDEYNKIGNQVQLEMFNEYFEDLNQQLRIPENDSEYSNRVKNLEEKLAPFKTIPTICSYNGPDGSKYFNLPNPVSLTGQETITTAIGQQVYNFQVLQAAQVAAGITKVFLGGFELTPNVQYVIAAGGGSISIIPSPTAVGSLQVYLYENDFYKLGTVIYNDELEIERLNRNDFLYINMSPLTKPTKDYPIFIFEDNKLYVYPKTITDGVKANYLKKPININWGFTVAGGGNYIYNPANSVNFEVQPTEQTSLITRILLYAGVVVRDPQLVQMAAGQIQNEKVNEKS